MLLINIYVTLYNINNIINYIIKLKNMFVETLIKELIIRLQ